jgi:GABA(A) receptor-associated protein
MNFQYKNFHSLDQRRFESERIRRRYPDRIPVIVEPLLSSSSSSSSNEVTLTRLENEKFLVPSELSFGQFAYNIRRRLRLRSEHALFFYIGSYGKQPLLNSTMELLYHQNKDIDGFLYVCYAEEKVFG